jgi:outer membrane protein OmpA-like peptidoglycan-associated protein
MASGAAWAQHRGDGDGHWRGGGAYRSWDGGHRHYAPSWRYYGRSWGPSWSLGFYDPGYYVAPVPYAYAPGYLYPYPTYAAPLVAEPAYPLPPPPVYEPRRYAEVVPPPPRAREPAPKQPPAASAAPPAPRFDRYTLSAKELFAFDRDTLRTPQPKLDEIAAALKENPGIRNVIITGYTDRLGSEAYNQALSQRRADAVKDYLVRQGVEASRLHASGRGEANPVVHCEDQDRAALIRCLEPNRRVEVEEFTVERRAR